MAKIHLLRVTLLLIGCLASISDGKVFSCNRFADDLQNDELALKEVKTQLSENYQLQFDLGYVSSSIFIIGVSS